MSTLENSSDEQRFTAPFDDAYDDVLRFVRRRLGEEESDDVVADAFLTVWSRLDDLPAEPGDARAWLFGIARGTMANARRSDRRRHALGARLAQVDASSGRRADDTAEPSFDVSLAWKRLAKTDQEALALTLLDGHTSAQAAQVLGTTSVAYRLRLSRARRRLQGLLEEGRPTISDPAPATRADTAWEATS